MEISDVIDVSKVNILVVDDLLEKHLVLQTVLAELAQNIVFARSGREALRLVLEKEFAVILLDVNMPDMDGFETAALIRQYKKTAKTPIVFISAYVDDIQAIKGYALGAVDYIASPVIPEILRSKVRVFVELHLMNLQLRQQAIEREALILAEAARAAAEAASHRADFLASASHTLTHSIEFEPTIKGLLEIAVPHLADFAMLSLVNEEAEISRMELAGPKDRGPSYVRSVSGSPPLCAYLSELLSRPRTYIFKRADIEQFGGDSRIGEVFEIFGAEVQSIALFPLFSASHKLGVLTLGFFSPMEPQATKLSLAIELVSRASIAIENAFLYKTIQDANQRKNEFLAMLAHELRNPLAPIRNAVHIMDAVKTLEPTVAWSKDVIGRQIDHMARIVDDLLDVSRIARGKILLEKKPFSARTAMERAIETCLPALKDREQQFKVELPRDSILIDGDLIRLSQVFSNLINNASKFTPQNGLITLHSSYTDGQIGISVADNGQGISEAFQPYVFDLFTQVDQSLDRAQGGLGIGLTLAKHLVELHGGRIEVKSEGLGKGAEFTVYLSAQEGILPEYQDKKIKPSRAKSSARALVVDDLAASADTLKMLLQLEGHEVKVASDGGHALELAESFAPDVILLDIGLPGMNGLEVARKIRMQDANRHTLLIALTGYGQEADRHRAVEAGFDHHFVKPANIEKLLQIISEYCTRRPPRVDAKPCGKSFTPG